jgi:uncharacterized protein
MRWDDFRRSDNVEDDRGSSGGFPGGFGVPGGAGGLSIGTVVVLGLVGWALGIDPSLLIGGAEVLNGNSHRYEQPYQREPRRIGRPTDATGDFVAAVLGDTEDRWGDIFRADGLHYRAPTLHLFTRALSTPCAFAQSAMGPFYCPNDQSIYLDTSFFHDLQTKFGGCDSNKACAFSEAYVIAHEVGHHVQNQLGILPKAQQAQKAAASKVDANKLQVRIELQADCFAGIWAHEARKKHDFLEPGDVDSALQTASAIGDDRLQQEARGYVVPDAFTHGTSEQRKRWFMTGFNEGKVSACNTFQAAQL